MSAAPVEGMTRDDVNSALDAAAGVCRENYRDAGFIDKVRATIGALYAENATLRDLITDNLAAAIRADSRAEQESAKRLEAGFDVVALRAERDALKQAYWEARAIMGFDNDGDTTPAALTYPSIPDLMKRDAQEIRRDYDEARLSESPIRSGAHPVGSGEAVAWRLLGVGETIGDGDQAYYNKRGELDWHPSQYVGEKVTCGVTPVRRRIAIPADEPKTGEGEAK